jgi:hypothetical protein
MHDWQSLSHVRWDCKYHIVPKYRKRKLYGKFKRHVGAGQSHVTYGEKCAIFSNISSFISNLEAMQDYHKIDTPIRGDSIHINGLSGVKSRCTDMG